MAPSSQTSERHYFTAKDARGDRYAYFGRSHFEKFVSDAQKHVHERVIHGILEGVDLS